MRMNAYDFLDRVQVTVSVREMETPLDHGAPWIPLVVTAVQGSGVTDRREWVQDALIAALESL